jgi:hypothetical protein
MNTDLTILVQSFGPIAFGLVSLLVIWSRIVGPELRAQREMVIKIASITSELRQSVSDLEQTTDKLRDAVAKFKATEANHGVR